MSSLASRLFGLIGYPLSHSFSKQYFTKKFEREGLKDCRYELFPLASIRELGPLLQQNPGLEGLNITIPYKKEALAYLDSSENIPADLDACNCIRIRDGKLEGFNTDTTGFEKTISPLLKPHHKKALILGNGGATAAVSFVLKKLGIDFQIVSRAIHDGSTLIYDDLGEEMIRASQVIINTTPLGMHPYESTFPHIPYRYISDQYLLYDLVYNPAKTVFLQKGEERGAVIKNGEEMLEVQAEESWRIWNS